MDLAAQLREHLRGTPGLRVAVLFGSRARGTARPDSDVDLGVLGELDRLSLAADLAEVLGLEVQVVDLADAPIPLLEEIVRDGRIVAEGAPGAGAVWWSHTLADLETDRPWHRRMQEAWVARVKARGIF